MLESLRWVGVVMGWWPLYALSVSPSPLGTNWVFELGWTGLWVGRGVLGIRVWGQGLTILIRSVFSTYYCF